jgi:thiol-disulfide isomerase/thioredoxin
MNKILYIIIGLAFLVGVAWLIVTPGKPGELDAFATCIKDSGAKFYGAFWCPHCQNQKALFGRSAKLLPYIECSTPDGKSQLSVCKDLDIKTYPTWYFASSTATTTEIITGEITLEGLAMKTSCVLPELSTQ